VVAVARTGPALAELATTSPNIRTEVADAADAAVASSLLDQCQPVVLILVAGANPVMPPPRTTLWDTFSVNWHTDVKIAFTWLREALLTPLPPGSRVVVVSSGAAISGSPASGGYAGSKVTQRFIADYAPGRVAPCRPGRHRHGRDAQDDAVRRRGQERDPGVRGPQRPDRGGLHEAAGRTLDPVTAGSALVDLIRADPATTAPGYLLTAAGLQRLPIGYSAVYLTLAAGSLVLGLAA
jgi:hypothetical protein